MNVRTATALLSLALLGSAGVAAAQYQNYPGPPPRGQFNTWEAPPPEFAAAMQRGYRDGVIGARRDFENHRPPNVMNRDEFRNPHFIAPPDRHDYRIGFRRGYDSAVHHIYGHREY